MVIATQQNSVVLQGNGSDTVFEFPFIGDSVSFISVIYTDSEGAQTTLLPSQYTVSLNPPLSGQLWGQGGTVTYPLSGTPIAAGTSLTIMRTLPLTQETSIQNQGPFFAQVTEQALDTLAMQIQQVSAKGGQLRGTWVSGVQYNFGDIVTDGPNGDDTQNLYICPIPNISSVWNTDLAVGYWNLVLNVQGIVNTLPSIAPGQVLANNTFAPATPTGVAVTTLFDTIFGSAEGGFLTRGSSVWVFMGPGTYGQFLMSQGPGARAVWSSASGTGTITEVSAGTGLTGGGSSGAVTLALAAVNNNLLLANTSGSSTAPVPTGLSAFIDAAIGSTIGSILYRSTSGAWVLLAPGTSGQFLQTSGASANPQWASVTTNSGMILLQNQSVSGVGSVVFTSSNMTGYDRYVIHGNNIIAQNALEIQISTNGGSSYLSTGYANSTSGTITTTGINLGIPAQPASGCNSMTTLMFQNITASVFPIFNVNTSSLTPSTASNLQNTGIYTTATAFNALRFIPTSGVVSGQFNLYGMAGN